MAIFSYAVVSQGDAAISVNFDGETVDVLFQKFEGERSDYELRVSDASIDGRSFYVECNESKVSLVTPDGTLRPDDGTPFGQFFGPNGEELGGVSEISDEGPTGMFGAAAWHGVRSFEQNFAVSAAEMWRVW